MGVLERRSELKSALETLGWSNQDLAGRVGVHPNTVTNWLTLGSGVPGAVLAYLRLTLRVKRLAADV